MVGFRVKVLIGVRYTIQEVTILLHLTYYTLRECSITSNHEALTTLHPELITSPSLSSQASLDRSTAGGSAGRHVVAVVPLAAAALTMVVLRVQGQRDQVLQEITQSFWSLVTIVWYHYKGVRR